MKKIKSNEENPLDVLNIRLADILSPVFKSMNFTANNITFLSLIFGLLSIYFLYRYNFYMFAIMYYISYFFDCMDGHYARKYKMVSKFGDYFDHIKDVLVCLGIFIVVIKQYKLSLKKWIGVIVILSLFTILMLAHLGCQEKIYHQTDNGDDNDNGESPSLSSLKNLCFGKADKSIQFTKWFGCGTWVIVLILCIFYVYKSRLN